MTKMLSDWLAMVERHLLHLRHIKERVVSVVMLPALFVVVFGLMFGSVITVPGGGYQEYLMAGIFVQVMLSAVTSTAVGTIEDLRNGLMDRLRSLPMADSAPLIGRSVGDTALRAVGLVPMALVGYLIGWRVHGSALSVLAGFALVLLFGFTMAWVGALLGLTFGSAETAVAFPSLLLMPALFLSNAFVPLTSLPTWLRMIAEWNPLSAVIGAVRALWGNPIAAGSDAFPVRYPVLMGLFWLAAVLAVVVPMAGRKYRIAVAR